MLYMRHFKDSIEPLLLDTGTQQLQKRAISQHQICLNINLPSTDIDLLKL